MLYFVAQVNNNKLPFFYADAMQSTDQRTTHILGSEISLFANVQIDDGWLTVF